MSKRSQNADAQPLGDEIVRTDGRILPGGKVDPEAIRRAIDEARERAAAQQSANAEGEAEEVPGEDDAELRRVVFELRRDLDKRLDKYLTDRITFMSRTQLQRLIDEGGVLVNAKVPRASTKLHAGDVVEVVVPPPPASNIQPEDIPLDVLFEDEHIIVLNKQPDIIVHPARSHLKGTMLSALAYHFKHRSRLGGDLSKVGEEFARPGVVHRLDRHTSGCIVFAKSDEAHWKLGHQFEHRRVDKRYLAVVHGLVEPGSDVINLPLGPHPSREKGFREKYVVRHDELGKEAVTIYRVRERYAATALGSPAGAAAGFSLVELELKTGRTHQIRVHLSHHLWPIVGDDMYGGRALGVRASGGREELIAWNAGGMGPSVPPPGPDVRPLITRQALHACVLAFAHPISGEPLRFTAPLRGDMGELVGALRRLSAPGAPQRLDPPGASVDLERALSGVQG